MTENISKIGWNKRKSQIRAHWSKITEADLEQLNGNFEGLVSILRRRYGYGKVQAEIEINNWLNDLKRKSSKN